MTRRVEGALLAACLVAGAVLFTQGLDKAPNYDEGVYLASDDALRAGGELGSEVFTSQPPVFYLLLRLATAVPGDSIASSRMLFVLLALVGVVAAWALGRTLVSPSAGLISAAALTVAPAYAGHAARVSADVPAMALALSALAALALARERESKRLAVGAGALLAFAIGVKLLAVVALVPAAALLRRGLRTAVAAGAALVAVLVLVAVVPALDDLWRDVVGFHNDARGGSLAENAESVLRSLHPRRAWAFLVLAAVLVALLRAPLLRRTGPVWIWTAAACAFLAWHRPLLDHHFALLAAAGSVAAGATLGGGLDRLRGRVAAAGAAMIGLVLLAAAAQQWRAGERLAAPRDDVDRAARLVAAATAPGDAIVTDLPIVAHVAGRVVPGALVDTSAVRFEAGSLEPSEVLEVAEAAGVRVVVIGRMFRTLPALLTELERRFPDARRVGEITVRERDRAAARAAQAAARG